MLPIGFGPVQSGPSALIRRPHTWPRSWPSVNTSVRARGSEFSQRSRALGGGGAVIAVAAAAAKDQPRQPAGFAATRRPFVGSLKLARPANRRAGEPALAQERPVLLARATHKRHTQTERQTISCCQRKRPRPSSRAAAQTRSACATAAGAAMATRRAGGRLPGGARRSQTKRASPAQRIAKHQKYERQDKRGREASATNSELQRRCLLPNASPALPVRPARPTLTSPFPVACKLQGHQVSSPAAARISSSSSPSLSFVTLDFSMLARWLSPKEPQDADCQSPVASLANLECSQQQQSRVLLLLLLCFCLCLFALVFIAGRRLWAQSKPLVVQRAADSMKTPSGSAGVVQSVRAVAASKHSTRLRAVVVVVAAALALWRFNLRSGRSSRRNSARRSGGPSASTATSSPALPVPTCERSLPGGQN